MAPSYKLTYFPVEALGEPIRYMLSYANIEFEDYRLDVKDWPKLKPSTPFGKVPVLEVDGKKAHQSVPICRYLAKQCGLVGKSDWDALQADIIVDTITDFRVVLASYHYDTDPASKEAKREGVQTESVPFYLSKLDEIVKENGGYFVNNQLTWADVYFAGIYNYLEKMAGKLCLKNYPHLKNLIQKVNSIPQIKSWIEKRPKVA